MQPNLTSPAPQPNTTNKHKIEEYLNSKQNKIKTIHVVLATPNPILILILIISPIIIRYYNIRENSPFTRAEQARRLLTASESNNKSDIELIIRELEKSNSTVLLRLAQEALALCTDTTNTTSPPAMPSP